MNRRLLGLLAVLAALGVLRWIDPLQEKTAPVVEATQRTAPREIQPVGDTFGESNGEQPSAERVPVSASTGNAFKPRGAIHEAIQPPPSLQPPPPAPRTVVAVNIEEAPPAPAPLPPPPLQVIGTWDDGSAPGVFVAGPQGTLLVRTGQTILDDYKVQKITKRELILTQLSIQRDWPLSIPAATDTPPMYLKK